MNTFKLLINHSCNDDTLYIKAVNVIYLKAILQIASNSLEISTLKKSSSIQYSTLMWYTILKNKNIITNIHSTIIGSNKYIFFLLKRKCLVTMKVEPDL